MPTIEEARALIVSRMERTKGKSNRYANALDLFNRGLDPHQIHTRLGWTPQSKTSVRRALIRYGQAIDTYAEVLRIIDGTPDPDPRSVTSEVHSDD